MTPDEIVALLDRVRTIAVVGASPDPLRHSNEAVHVLRDAGYRVFPVNPTVEAVEGQPSSPDVASIGEPVDLAVVFRRSEAAGVAARDALRSGVQAIWLQTGIVSDEARAAAEEAGAAYVENRCIMATLRSLGRAG